MMTSLSAALFSRPWLVCLSAVLLRLILLVYGRWQDAHSPVKYTDIDYLVFTDASRFISWRRSPYDRATYRYTPLLAWLLYPTSWGGLWFEFGKALFAAGDVVTGYLVARILMQQYGMRTDRAMKYASIWLLNPMVANISTRGSSEGLLAMLVVLILQTALEGSIWTCGLLLGMAVHFKIYPFIYAATVFWWLSPERIGSVLQHPKHIDMPAWIEKLFILFNRQRRALAVSSFVAFMSLNGLMLKL